MLEYFEKKIGPINEALKSAETKSRRIKAQDKGPAVKEKRATNVANEAKRKEQARDTRKRKAEVEASNELKQIKNRALRNTTAQGKTTDTRKEKQEVSGRSYLTQAEQQNGRVPPGAGKMPVGVTRGERLQEQERPIKLHHNASPLNAKHAERAFVPSRRNIKYAAMVARREMETKHTPRVGETDCARANVHNSAPGTATSAARDRQLINIAEGDAEGLRRSRAWQTAKNKPTNQSVLKEIANLYKLRKLAMEAGRDEAVVRYGYRIDFLEEEAFGGATGECK